VSPLAAVRSHLPSVKMMDALSPPFGVWGGHGYIRLNPAVRTPRARARGGPAPAKANG
jgi:hypothetical protein